MLGAERRRVTQPGHYWNASGPVADVTVRVRGAKLSGRLVLVNIRVLVLVLMMAKMLRSRGGLFMLAVRRSRSPQGLQRQQNQQQDS